MMMTMTMTMTMTMMMIAYILLDDSDDSSSIRTNKWPQKVVTMFNVRIIVRR